MSMSAATGLFRTTLTRTIKLNRLLNAHGQQIQDEMPAMAFSTPEIFCEWLRQKDTRDDLGNRREAKPEERSSTQRCLKSREAQESYLSNWWVCACPDLCDCAESSRGKITRFCFCFCYFGSITWNPCFPSSRDPLWPLPGVVSWWTGVQLVVNFCK